MHLQHSAEMLLPFLQEHHPSLLVKISVCTNPKFADHEVLEMDRTAAVQVYYRSLSFL